MAIENRNIRPGDRFVATYKGTRCTVVALAPDALSIESPSAIQGRALPTETVYKSLSSAGKAIMGGVACNGWRFFSREGEEPEPKARKAKEKNDGKVVRQIKKVPNQKGVAEGSVKYHCSACQKAFVVEGESEPEACPEGHPREVEDELAPTS